jgi:hypothetical protein
MSISIGALILVTLTSGGQDDQIKVLQEMVHELREEVAELKNKDSETWLTQQRADEVRALVREVLFDADTRNNLVGNGALAGYDGGAYVQSADGNWKLKINGQLQTRWLYNNAKNQTSQHGFEQRRTKIKFSGFVYDPSWTFKITPTWGRGGGSSTEDAWISKSFDDGGWIKFGQFNSKFLREQVVSSSAQLAVERSMVNNAFTYGWTQGIEFGWKDEDVQLTVQYTDGPNQFNSPALGVTTNAWNVRGEFRFGDAGWKEFASLSSKEGRKNGFLLGIAYENYSSDNTTLFEYGNADATKSYGWTVDATLIGDGWTLFAYMVETTGKTRGTALEQDSSGWLVQGGMMISANAELFAQYQQGEINDATFAQGSNDMSVFRVGMNYWPVAGSNNLKWTTDIAWAPDSLANGVAVTGIGFADWVGRSGWRPDSQNNDGQMLLRTQLQLLF